jgi:hypothetical protein
MSQVIWKVTDEKTAEVFYFDSQAEANKRISYQLKQCHSTRMERIETNESQMETV